MTPDAYARRCTNAKLTVLDVTETPRQCAVTVKRVPTSASGLQALAERLGVASMTVAFGDGSGTVTLWFAHE